MCVFSPQSNTWRGIIKIPVTCCDPFHSWWTSYSQTMFFPLLFLFSDPVVLVPQKQTVLFLFDCYSFLTLVCSCSLCTWFRRMFLLFYPTPEKSQDIFLISSVLKFYSNVLTRIFLWLICWTPCRVLLFQNTLWSPLRILLRYFAFQTIFCP